MSGCQPGSCGGLEARSSRDTVCGPQHRRGDCRRFLNRDELLSQAPPNLPLRLMSPQNATHFAGEFGPHTLLKHGILSNYVERWARILLNNHPVLRIVDACAGEGGDAAGNPGSPLIALREGARAAEQVGGTVEVVAIEKQAKPFKVLQERLSGEPGIQLVRGTLADVLAAHEPQYERVPHFYFVDPFGLDPLRADLIRRTLAGPRNEVFLLFAGQAALRHFGAVQALERSQAQDGFFDVLFPDDPTGGINPHLEITAEHAERILTAAYGDRRWEAAARLQAGRMDAFLKLYMETLRSFGAQYVFAVPMLDDTLTYKYHLVHASRSPRGYEVMKDAIARALNRDTLSQSATNAMRAAMAADLTQISAKVAHKFAGKSVLWTPVLRDYVIQQTPLMPYQTKDLRRQLKESGFLTEREGGELYSFPPP